jgi:hypothetical protein
VPQCLHMNDRGSQYTSEQFQNLMADLHFTGLRDKTGRDAIKFEEERARQMAN